MQVSTSDVYTAYMYMEQFTTKIIWTTTFCHELFHFIIFGSRHFVGNCSIYVHAVNAMYV